MVWLDWAMAAGAALLGGGWRRWEGQAMTGFLAHRWVKLTVATLFGFGVAYYWMRDPLAAAAVAAVTTIGWTPPAQFGRIDTNFEWPLLARYGGVTFFAALVAAILTNNVHSMPYAPIGMLAPVGYKIGQWTNKWHGCWTCCGEIGLGVIVYGGMFLLRQ